VLEWLGGLAHAAGLRDPDRLAAQLLVLMDGTWVAARMFGPGNHAGVVREAAEALIEAHVSDAPEAHASDAPVAGSRRR
jgi:hypothetical protein